MLVFDSSKKKKKLFNAAAVGAGCLQNLVRLALKIVRPPTSTHTC